MCREGFTKNNPEKEEFIACQIKAEMIIWNEAVVTR
jgi:hypothetical protein